MLARILFENLLVPSVSFAPSGLLALVGVGRTTGLVVDCGYLETCVLPVSAFLSRSAPGSHRQFFASRPMYPHIQATPLAGMRLNSHIRALLLMFSLYLPPPATLGGAVNQHATIKPTRVPDEVLTDTLIEEIKTRCCYVGEPLPPEEVGPLQQTSASSSPPPSSDPVLSDSEADVEMESNDPQILSIDKLYRRHSRATELRIRVTPPASQLAGTGLATLVVPGWIRERAAELLFEDGDLDEQSVVEVVLRSLRKVSNPSVYLASILFKTGKDSNRSPPSTGFQHFSNRWYCNVARFCYPARTTVEVGIGRSALCDGTGSPAVRSLRKHKIPQAFVISYQ
jgi:actin-related protein 10